MSQNNTTTGSNLPFLIAYNVRETGNGQNFWNRIGAAWKNNNGGFTLQLDSVPLDGRIVCQPAETTRSPAE
jgi:hypothetical protein